MNVFTPRDLSIGTIISSPNMYARTYQINATPGNIDTLLRNTNNGDNINTKTISDSADIIGMSSDASNLIDIDGGWDTPRCIFEMILESNTTGSLYLLTGYMSADFMINGQINTRALVHFDTYTEMSRYTDSSGVQRYRPTATDNILSAVRYNGNTETGRALHARPKDIIESSSTYAIEDLVGDNVSGLGQYSTGGSTARNTQTHLWLGRSVNSLVDSMNTTSIDETAHSYGVDGDMHSIISGAAMQVHVSETELSTAPLIGSILESYHDMRAGEVTWGVLLQHLPELGNMVRPPNPANNGQQIALSAWNNRDTAIIISEYANAIPGILRENSIRYLDHTISNADGEYHSNLMEGYTNTYQINDGPNSPGVLFSVPNADAVEILKRVELRIRNMVFPKISKGHKMTISCRCSTISEMTIIVNWNGHEFAHTAPTWASSAWMAVSANDNSVTDLAHGSYRVAQALVNSRDDQREVHSGNDTQPAFYNGDGLDDLINN